MKTFFLLLLSFYLSLAAQAEYKIGAKHHVKNDALQFDTAELIINGKFAGFIYDDSHPISFSNKYYVYATCPVDKVTNEPNGHCINWKIYDDEKKSSAQLTLPGLTFSSTPSFSWPYIAYVMVPNKITSKDFKNGFVEVSCVVVEWPKKNVVVQQKIQVNVGHFEGDTPGSFYPPKFRQNKDSIEVTCLEYNGEDAGNVISKVVVPRKK